MKNISSNFVSGLLIFSLILFVLCALVPSYMAGHRHGPSFATQRIEQRQVALKRVFNVGGWNVLRRDCEFLVTNSQKDFFMWHPRLNDYGPIPPVISNLEPQEVQFDLDTNFPVVRLQFFGGHRTGSPDIPYYGFWVVCNSTNKDFTPSVTYYGSGRHINKISDFVFEVYQ